MKETKTSGSNKQARGGSAGHLQITTRIARSLSSWQIPEITRNAPVHKLLYRSRAFFATPRLTGTTFPSSLGPNPWQNYSKQLWQAGNTSVDVECFLKGRTRAAAFTVPLRSCLNRSCIISVVCFNGTWEMGIWMNHDSWISFLLIHRRLFKAPVTPSKIGKYTKSEVLAFWSFGFKSRNKKKQIKKNRVMKSECILRN